MNRREFPATLSLDPIEPSAATLESKPLSVLPLEDLIVQEAIIKASGM